MKVDDERMPRTRFISLPVLVLAATLFVVTTSEFQVAAMLTTMSADLGVPVSELGLLVTVYALGMGLGGPLIAWTLRRMRPDRALVLVLIGYAVAEAGAGASHESVSLSVLRFVTGALSGATFGLALSVGMAASAPERASRASATVLTGLMAGTLLGLPLSHVLAEVVGWRASFLVLATAAVLMACAVIAIVPATPLPVQPSTEAGVGPRSRALWLRYLGSLLTIGGAFAAFTYIEPLLQRSGLTPVGVIVAMLGFGVAAFTVNAMTGRVRRATARRWLLVGLIVQLGALALLLSNPGAPIQVVAATVLVGGTGIALNPLLVTRVLAIARPSVMVNTVHTSAITLGIAGASAIGSKAIDESGDLGATLWVGLALTVGAGLLAVATPDPPSTVDPEGRRRVRPERGSL